MSNSIDIQCKVCGAAWIPPKLGCPACQRTPVSKINEFADRFATTDHVDNDMGVSTRHPNGRFCVVAGAHFALDAVIEMIERTKEGYDPSELPDYRRGRSEVRTELLAMIEEMRS